MFPLVRRHIALLRSLSAFTLAVHKHFAALRLCRLMRGGGSAPPLSLINIQWATPGVRGVAPNNIKTMLGRS